MTDNQILELAKQRLQWEVDDNDVEYFSTSQQIIEFAQAIYEKGYIQGVESVRSGILGD